MRIKLFKFTGFLLVFINVIVVFYIWRLFITSGQLYPTTLDFDKPPTKVSTPRIGKSVTLIIRDFELHENDVTDTVQSFLNVYPNIQIIVLCEGLPYPPLELMYNNVTLKNVKIIDVSPSFDVPFYEHYPLYHIRTKYVLFVPDSTRLPNRQQMHLILSEIVEHRGDILAISVSHKNLNCFKIHKNIREWTIKYESIKNHLCDSVSGKHLTFMETNKLRKIPNMYLLPFPQSLYLQTSFLNYTVKILRGVTFQDGKPLLRSHHAQWIKKQTDNERFKHLYNTFKIKQVIHDGVTEWYGCTRETTRCFTTVVNSMPSYLYEGLWTPPCCLSNLRVTARHVFNCLDEAGVRYWLESASLLGAMRNGDILQWDHDVDIGINRDDISRCVWLEKAKFKQTVDTKGFLWERATEGNFFRVHFSKRNKIYVNLFPFYSKNGTMSKDSWYTSHKNMEFSDRFLHPMSSIEFIGRHVPSPNNIRDFLESKFGKGAIENPHYPDPNILKFP